MKKIILLLVFSLIICCTSCMVSNEFSSFYHLAITAIANGSEDTVLEYSLRLKELSKTKEENSIAHMIRGYGYYLSGNYNQALTEYDLSRNYSDTEEAYTGILLSYALMSDYEMINLHLDFLENIPDRWTFLVNKETITKSRLYELCALSSAIQKNREIFDSLKDKISIEKTHELEGFFFE